MEQPNRVAALEERVARLEAALAASVESTPTVVSPETSDDDTFWALDRLKQDLPPGGAVLFTGATTLPSGERYEWQETTPASDLLDQDWTETATSLIALAHPMRLLMLRAVLLGARSVNDLKEMDNAGTSGQTYHHLRQLLAAGWLRPAGRARYAIPPERVIPLLVTYLGATR